jgi:tetratricopeptide (TPR) repeat protein
MASMSLQAAYDQARQSLESNDTDRAIGLAQHILEQYPDNLEAYRILGEAYLATRQLSRAQESFERVLRSDPENIPAHVGLGITSERQGQLERAITEFEQALEIKPDMTEIRSQLLRLYSEGWGSENAQLRLSRAGLARLYAKGHMLPQAITEFRQVIADQPQRFDAKVALAETLWRDGQEEDAIQLCRDILDERPESLKANLLLGYLLKSAGQPEGARYWETANRMDPYQGVAQVLFDSVPEQPKDEPLIDAWDETAWRSRRAAEQQEPLAATRPMEAVTPPGTTVEPSAGLTSWLDQLTSATPAAAPETHITTPSAPETDDFLASLLSFDQPAETPPTHQTQPLSAADLAPEAHDSVPPAPTSDAPDMTPFSLADLGLSDDEIAGLNDVAAPATPEVASSLPAPTSDAPDMTPFSLADLGLSDDEIAGLNDVTAPATPEPTAPSPDPTSDAPDMTPFSLSDLGLSDDEIAGLNDVAAPATSEVASSLPAPTSDAPDMTPFSLADLGLSDDEIAGLNDLAAPTAPVDAPQVVPAENADVGLTPFSLADLGISDEEIAGLDSLQSADTTQPSASGNVDLDNDLPSDLQPFSFDEIDLDADAPAQNTTNLPSSLQPFSLEDTPPDLPRGSLFAEPTLEHLDLNDDDEAASEPRGFGWQQAAQKSEPGFVKSLSNESPSTGEQSIFSKLKHKYDNTELPPAPPVPDVTLDPDEHLGLFSMDDVSLRDEPEALADTPPAAEMPTPAVPVAPEVDNLQDALNSGQVQPFSLADLGLSDEEIAALEGSTTAPTAEVSAEVPAAEIPAPAVPVAPEVDNLQDALNSGQVQPFSLADLGLSDEEIAALEGSTTAPTAEVKAEVPTVEVPEAEIPAAEVSAAPEIENLQDALNSGQVQPFSLADLGLSDEEIAALGDSGAPVEDAAPKVESYASPEQIVEPVAASDAEATQPDEETENALGVSDLTPFSLADLGLSDDEINALGLESDADQPSEVALGLTEEDMEGLDGGDLNWSNTTSEPPPAPAAPPGDDIMIMSGDLAIDRLIALGRQQGYIDISDIIANVEDPEAEADRIEEIGMRLHEAHIEIRDGDEVIDMDAEYAEDEAYPYTEESAPSEPRTPYPRDLDLMTDEFDVPVGAAPVEPVAKVPDMTPFSLADLGLSDAEIAALGLGEAEAALPTPEPVTPEPTSEEPNLTPFSLAELGLSEDEIASLGLADPAAPTATEEPVQPVAEMPAPEPMLDEPAAVASPSESAVVEPAMPDEVAAEPTVDATTPIAPEVTTDDEVVEATASVAPSDVAASLPAEPTVPVVPPDVPAATPPVSVAPSTTPSTEGHTQLTGNEVLDAFFRQLEAEPNNDVLRLSIARVLGQLNMADPALKQYRFLVKNSSMLEQVVSELQDMIAYTDDVTLLKGLHRALGDAYSKQGRLKEAVDEYSWTLGGPRSAR